MSGAESSAPAPIIVTALLGREDFAWADSLRRAYFPPAQNQLRAHITLFHHLPPSVEGELCDLLRHQTRQAQPRAHLASVVSLGSGVAFRIESPELQNIRAIIAEHFAALLIPQDRAGWRPHITVQNKVKADAARALYRSLLDDFVPRPIAIAGLAAWWYRGGPWESIGAWAFGTGHAMKAPS